MRVKVKKHISFRGVYDRFEIIEALNVTKDIQYDKCWLNVDGMGFEMPEEDADKMINEIFQTGTLDLSNYDESNIPW